MPLNSILSRNEQGVAKSIRESIILYHHHHDVVQPARISLTLSRHFSLSFIASGRYSGLHPVPSQSYCMYVRAGRPAFARPYVGVHRSTSLMCSSQLLQQCPALKPLKLNILDFKFLGFYFSWLVGCFFRYVNSCWVIYCRNQCFFKAIIRLQPGHWPNV